MSRAEARPMADARPPGYRADEPSPTMQDNHPEAGSSEHDLIACIEACSECHDVCQQMVFQHCLQLGGKHAEPEHLKLMTDCIQICHTAADFMLRASPRHTLVCDVCAEICEACADDCERIGEMEECVEVCRHCAECCREMAAA